MIGHILNMVMNLAHFSNRYYESTLTYLFQEYLLTKVKLICANKIAKYFQEKHMFKNILEYGRFN